MQDQNLLSSTGADIDGFIDGAYTNTPTAWINPSNAVLVTKTHGVTGVLLHRRHFSSRGWNRLPR
jgi:hypothetical protein